MLNPADFISESNSIIHDVTISQPTNNASHVDAPTTAPKNADRSLNSPATSVTKMDMLKAYVFRRRKHRVHCKHQQTNIK
ncbi:hypothetical protein EB796_013926 [Bugula neritina]|uniref:Uncharacterized protein n=1 Tax=Bugula neritina TaxID=10212 RepID=A0A7J7IUB2_BUGNE|nr:hypothetical protein EB796_024309 [Bugula neritina]KAF6027762.1 hypothetical protein EB796_013926 [Bugula neritina]